MTNKDESKLKLNPDEELEALQNKLPPLHGLPVYSPEKLLTIDETAEILNIPRRTLDNWRWKKNISLPWIKVAGKTVRYRMSDILEWLEAKTVR